MPLKTFKPGAQNGSLGICVYGRGGVGKTSLVGTMPGAGLIIDVPQIEGGTYVLEDKADRIDIIEVRTWDEIDDIFWALQKKDKVQLPNVDKYKWVAIDSITAMQQLAKRKVIKERDLDADPHQISQQEWGKIGQLVGELIFRFRTLSIATVFVAQERKHGGDDEPIMIGPDVIPSALAALMPPLMLVGRLTVQNDGGDGATRILRVQPHPLYVAKCRAKPGRKMPASVRNPNLEGILRYLLANGKRPQAAREDAAFIVE